MKYILFVIGIEITFCCNTKSDTSTTDNVLLKDDRINIEYFIMPKVIKFGFASLDIDSYGEMLGYTEDDYLRRSIYTSFENRKYNCLVKKDSLCEYFYLSEKGKFTDIEKKILNLHRVNIKEDMSFSRILLRFHLTDSIEELKIDQKYLVSYKGEKFRADSVFLDAIISIAPKEIQENWKHNLGNIHNIDLESVNKKNL